MKYWKCKICKKKFYSEDIADAHLQWLHNIPPLEAVLMLKKLKKEFAEFDRAFWRH